VFKNSWCDTGLGLVRVVYMSQTVNPHTEGIIQHPIKVMAPNTSMKDIEIEAITSSHYLNHCSSQLVMGYLSLSS
jgi:hypothetical protein